VNRVQRTTKFWRVACVLAVMFTTFEISMAQTGNITLPNTKENCEKINSYGQGNLESVAREYSVSVQSVKFLGARWEFAKNGFREECLMIFDTAVGPKQCSIPFIVSSDGGNTAFTTIDPFKFGDAGLCSKND
jgi:hypothetical protein